MTPKPTHWRVVCISIYMRDLNRADELVRELRRRGHRKATRSSLIRAALHQVDLDRLQQP